jgi:hypothetical protein
VCCKLTQLIGRTREVERIFFFTKCFFRLLDGCRTLYFNTTLLHNILSYYMNHWSTWANKIIPVILDVM